MSIAAPVALERKQYYTNGDTLYYLIRIHKDETITVENCSTLFIHRIPADILDLGWRRVEANVRS